MIIIAVIPTVGRRFEGGVFYGWWLIGIAAIVMILSVVPFFHTMTAWFVVLERHFGWNRTQLSLAFSLSRVEGGILGPLEGLLIDRLGSRRMVLIGLIIMAGGFLIFSRVQGLWHFYAAFLIMSLGMGLGTWLPMMTVLNSWFVRRRATSMSLVLVIYRLGVVAFVPLLTWAIDDDQFGWRAVAMGISVLVVLVAFPLTRLVRNRPEDYGSHPDGDDESAGLSNDDALESSQAADQEPDFTWREAIRTRPFWLMSFGHGCCSSIIVSIMVHLGPMLTDRGFSLQTVGWVVSAYTGIGIVSTLIGGQLGDRVPIRYAVFGFAILQSLAVLVLVVAFNIQMVLLFAFLMGAGEGRGSLTTAIRGVYFGRRAFASIMGMSMIPMNILLFSAPLFAGYMFDTTGSYFIPFVTIAVVSATGASLFLMLGEPGQLTSPADKSPAVAG
tara:strand:- start:73 stop:1395 length:1323 start_codon:yes stop_codon:yes gene_type:complete